MPTFIFLKNGIKIHEFKGANPDELQRTVATYVGGEMAVWFYSWLFAGGTPSPSTSSSSSQQQPPSPAASPFKNFPQVPFYWLLLLLLLGTTWTVQSLWVFAALCYVIEGLAFTCCSKRMCIGMLAKWTWFLIKFWAWMQSWKRMRWGVTLPLMGSNVFGAEYQTACYGWQGDSFLQAVSGNSWKQFAVSCYQVFRSRVQRHTKTHCLAIVWEISTYKREKMLYSLVCSSWCPATDGSSWSCTILCRQQYIWYHCSGNGLITSKPSLW